MQVRRAFRPVFRSVGGNGAASGAQLVAGGASRTRRLRLDRRFSFARRSAGVLMHLSSLPGPHGSGDLGPEAFAFADFLHEAGQRWWQMLPVGPPDAQGNSPYSALSAFAGNPWLVSLERLAEEGLLSERDVGPMGGREDRIEFARMMRFRERRLRRAYQAYRRDTGRFAEEAGEFARRSAHWLEDYALFMAVRGKLGGRPWDRWPRALRSRENAAIAQAKRDLGEEVGYHAFVQFMFDRQWSALKRYCAQRGVGLVGDIPIFVGYDSCDVWSRPELFHLDEVGRPRSVTGCPPDDFNCDGQNWGHPHYNWQVHRETEFAWWVSRFAATMAMFDGVRIDHFLGMHRLWSIPRGDKTARRGHWIAGPGRPLFEALKRELGNVPIIAEDLGAVTKEAMALRDRYRFPGMRVMQFGFGGDDHNLPHTYVRRCVAYTGTHDNETIAGWLASAARLERRKCLAYLDCTAKQAPRKMIRALMMSVADTVIIPTQDWLGLGREGRMNLPGTAKGNWAWRMKRGALGKELARWLAGLAELNGRCDKKRA